MIKFLFTFYIGSNLLDTISVNAKNCIDAIAKAFYVLKTRYNDYDWLLEHVTYNVKRIKSNEDKIPTVYNLKNNLSSFGSNYPLPHKGLHTYILADNSDDIPKAKKSPLHRIKKSYKEDQILSCEDRIISQWKQTPNGVK